MSPTLMSPTLTRSPLTRPTLLSPLLSALISALLTTACDSPLPNGYSAFDDLGELTTNLTRTYATGQRVTISFYADQSPSTDLSVESSDAALLKPVADPAPELTLDSGGECLGDALCDPLPPEPPQEEATAGGSVHQRFELLGEGEVKLNFKDGGELVRAVPIRLVTASRVESHVYYGSVASRLGGDTRLSDGAQFMVGRAHKIQLIPYLNDKALFVSSPLAEPTAEGAFLEGVSSPLWREGVVVTVRPEVEGDFSVHFNLGGREGVLALKAVGPSAVSDLEVKISRDDPSVRQNEDGTETSTPVGIAFAQGRDASGGVIYGADVVWERADTADGDSPQRVRGSSLRFEFSDTETVPFRVTSGDRTESVALPMNPNSVIWSNDDGYGGCSASGRGRGLSLVLVLSACVGLAVRRRAA
jgi:hypothetical protein